VGSQQCVSGGPGPCLGEVTPSTDFCNGLDDDCDGKTDEDFDLKTDPKHCGACSIFCRADQQCINGLCSKGQENCTDGIDNDKNGLTDCADPACLGQLCKPEPFAFTCGADLKCTCDGVAYPLPESDCSNHADDDCDGLADCADTADCEGKTCGSGCKCTAGLPAEVDCGNHIDDDRDGKTDCADPDCDNKECNDMQHGCACVGGLYTETNCADGIDNDGDHVKDCLDPDCDGKPCRLKVDGGMADGTCQSLACR
jgi:hypothetical protein